MVMALADAHWQGKAGGQAGTVMQEGRGGVALCAGPRQMYLRPAA